MWAPIQEIERRNSCFLACESYRPSFPMSRLKRLKAYLFGLLFKLGFYF